jgi:hypothetical protein
MNREPRCLPVLADPAEVPVGYPMDGFRLSASDFTYIGSDPRRPECAPHHEISSLNRPSEGWTVNLVRYAITD